MEQGSDAWKTARLGKATASRIADIIATTRSGWGASRATYEGELIAERLAGVPAESYTNSNMEWGTACEPEARAQYAFLAEIDVIETGFIQHPWIVMSGCSPDGLVGDDGLIEIKAPMTKTHIATLLGAPIDGKYLTQMMWQMACTGRQWVDYCSYDPRMSAEMRLFIKRVHRDDAIIADLEIEVQSFLNEVDKKLATLRAMYPGT